MEAHAAFPDGDDLEGMGEVIARFIEEHLAEAAAKDYAEHAIKQQIVELFRRHQRLLFEAPATQGNELNKSQQIHQAVPVDGQWADGNGDRVELRMKKH